VSYRSAEVGRRQLLQLLEESTAPRQQVILASARLVARVRVVATRALVNEALAEGSREPRAT